MTSGLIKNSVWSLSFRLLSALSGLLLTALLARLLTQAETGQYFILLSLASIGSVVLCCGMNFSVVRLIAEAQALQDAGRAKGVMLAALLTVAVAGVALGLAFFSAPGQALLHRYVSAPGPLLTALLLIWTLALAGQALFAELFRGLQNILMASLFGGVCASVLALGALLVGGWLTPLTLELAVTLVALATLTGVGLAALTLWRQVRRLPGAPHLDWRRLAAISLPLWITNLMLVVLVQADLWILNAQGDSAQVALYGAAVRLTQLLTLPLLVLNAALIPVISERHALGDLPGLQRLLRASAALAALPALLAVAIFFGAGGPLLQAFFGPDYAAAQPLLCILALGQLANVLCGSAGYTLMMTGRQQDMMWITLLAGLLMIGLGLYWVRQHGALGVACASALGLGAQSLAMWGRVRQRLGLWTHASPEFLLRPLQALRALL
ncbi:oligosaccharide flippase family protein [Pseudomonas sp. RIT-PI-AD]|uniref:lipopolysaccharide biosynthesis protein n=1 Tax=Pseudomonas sp. RIT-PI-AD TaxID=3035294 RepID=UPI0021DB1ADC|nr:oligosaccharide flippase family protein [Pseudomonas sp. RIT-PI-AD]